MNYSDQLQSYAQRVENEPFAEDDIADFAASMGIELLYELGDTQQSEEI